MAGAFLGAFTDTFARYPGLLVLVPAAIGLRGNIFGALGNRMSTTIHSGTFSWSLRRDGVLGQNVAASLVLTMGVSMLLAVVATFIASIAGVRDVIDVLEMSTISIVGGLLASAVVLAATLGLTGGAVRYGWDLDNVNAPLVSTLGDVLTLPALYLATLLVGVAVFSPLLGLALMLVSLVLLVCGWRAPEQGLREIVRHSIPVLAAAGCISAGAGVTIESTFDRFTALPALLVLVPAHLSSAGALGGMLSGRLSSKLFLGLVTPTAFPNRAARSDIGLVLAMALPIFVFNATGAHLVARLLGQASPGLGQMITLAILGGSLVIVFVVLVAYYVTVVAYRANVDPDTYGIPTVTSSVDLIGALALVAAILLLGLG